MKYILLLITFVSILLSGCLSPEGLIAKTKGEELYRSFRPQCNNSAWELHPKNIQPVTVKRLRNKRVHTGQECTPDITWKDQMNCENTYKNVQEAYYTEEYQDLNKSYRNNFRRSCMADKCAAEVDWSDPESDRIERYCNRGSPQNR